MCAWFLYIFSINIFLFLLIYFLYIFLCLQTLVKHTNTLVETVRPGKNDCTPDIIAVFWGTCLLQTALFVFPPTLPLISLSFNSSSLDLFRHTAPALGLYAMSLQWLWVNTALLLVLHAGLCFPALICRPTASIPAHHSHVLIKQQCRGRLCGPRITPLLQLWWNQRSLAQPGEIYNSSS